MYRKAFVIFGVLLFGSLFGQNVGNYKEIVNNAYLLYKTKMYKESGLEYSKAFNSHKQFAKWEDRYNASCAYALANMSDSAFSNLFYIAKINEFNLIESLSNDKDFKSLHNDLRWVELIEIVKDNRSVYESNLDNNLVSVLDTVLKTDQEIRQEYSRILEKYGSESDQLSVITKVALYQDSLNLVIVKDILDTHGWLGPKSISENGSTALFLVIQHSNLETQIKYLPMLRDAVENGRAKPSSLAYLEDRILTKQGKPQIYGSQLTIDEKTGNYCFYQIYKPEYVNIRRRDIGLSSIEEYASKFNISWDLEKHKKRYSIK